MTRSASASVPVRLFLAVALPACVAVALAGLAQPARAAAAITVGTCDESHLDAAVAQANSDNAGDTITFGCSGTIGLTGTLVITGSMTLDGTGQQITLESQAVPSPATSQTPWGGARLWWSDRQGEQLDEHFRQRFLPEPRR